MSETSILLSVGLLFVVFSILSLRYLRGVPARSGADRPFDMRIVHPYRRQGTMSSGSAS